MSEQIRKWQDEKMAELAPLVVPVDHNSEIASLEWRVVEAAVHWREELLRARRTTFTLEHKLQVATDPLPALSKAVDALIAARESEAKETVNERARA